MSRHLPFIAAAGLLLALSPAEAQDAAADYPNRPIRVMVSVPAGGGVDTVTRLVTEKMRTRLGQPFVMENRGGAGGNLAAEAVFNAEPDGYQLLTSQPSPISTNVVLYKKLNIDPSKFEFVGIMSTIPNVLLVKNDFPAKTAQEFMTYVKANASKINYASQGPGTTSHLTAELFQRLTGTKLVHVPYKGTAPALNDLVAGHVDFIFMQLESALKLHEGGKARILAVTTNKRLQELPDVPTMIEVGVPGLISDTWNAISAPPKTPAPIVAKLNAVLNDALKDPELIARYRALNLLPGGGTPAETRAFIQEDTRRWSEVIRAANIAQIE
jgi:tripartite-type tricarboxylate transporter receptor subunit TctC